MINFGLVIIFLVLLTHALFTDGEVKSEWEKRKCQFNKSDAPRCRTMMAVNIHVSSRKVLIYK